MSLVLLITCAIAASASATGFVLGRRRWRKATPGAIPAQLTAGSGPEVPSAAALPKKDSIEMQSLAVSLGDVVSVDGRERWLAGAIVVFDGTVVAAGVFFAPEGKTLEVVASFPEPRRSILWLSPVDIEIGHEAPTSLEINSVFLQRKRRLPVQLKRAGQGAPELGSTATLSEYAATGGDAALILRTPERTFGWFGREIAHPDYDRMGKGTPTE